MAIVSSVADTAAGPVSTGPVARVGGNPFRFLTTLRPGDILAIAPFIIFAALFLVIPTLSLVVGAFVDADVFESVLGRADRVLEAGAPFHIHFSDIAYANRNETRHLPYGEGTLRAEPLRDALARFERPATVITESPDEDSHQAIRAILSGGAAA